MKTIGLDLDGVVYDYHTVTYNHLVKERNLTLKPAEFWGNGESIYSEKVWYNLLRIPILYEKAPINDDDLDVLNYLSRSFNLVYITNRPREVEFVTRWWMKENKIPQTSNLYFVTGSKVPLILKNQCEYFIDDRLSIVKELENYTNPILVRKDWHSKEELVDILYIRSLKELLEIGL